MIEKTEKVVIGTILSIPEFQEQIINQVNVDLFSFRLNRLVFECALNLYENNSKIDLLTVNHNFSKQEIEKAVKSGRKDDLWKNNFLSLTKLRTKNAKQECSHIDIFLNLSGNSSAKINETTGLPSHICPAPKNRL